MSRSIRTLAFVVAAVLAASIHVNSLSAQERRDAPQKRGLLRKEANVAPGYTLISPFSSKATYLLDADGNVVHQWESRYTPGLSAYLLPHGHLLRGIQVGLASRFEGGGISGGLQEFDWDGKLLWEFHLASDLHYYHHDIEPLPNGNILMIVWEPRSKEETLQAGRHADHVGDAGIWPEAILEVEPLRPYGARVVWEWHVWDHLIQDTDPKLPNYGVVSEHPERLDINVDVPRNEEGERGAGEGEGGQDAARRRPPRTDWLHFNGIDYNAELDQIVVSSHSLSEIWIIDHSTSTEEAAGSTGGRSGRGGDLLYRWGNPRNYQSGKADDQQLFRQHDPEWIPAGFPGAGNITIFNNGVGRTGGENYSTVVEIEPPLRPDGTYARDDGQPFPPLKPTWEYNPAEEERFFANFISGAHRLANGNTLVCSGPTGRVTEVTPEGKIVWEFANPFAVPGDRNRDRVDDREYALFRATRIPPDHPALSGKSLVPLDPQPKTAETLLAERPQRSEEVSGWRSLSRAEGPPPWNDINGDFSPAFRGEPDGDGGILLTATGESSGTLCSDRMYENFIFELEWRIADERADAGLIIWADSLPAVGSPQPRGMEIDICDRENTAESTSHGDIVPVGGASMMPEARFRHAGDRSLPNESDFNVRPRGEWNQYRITAVDGSVTLEVNGKLVSGGSRGTPAKGRVCVTSQRGSVQFRNARIWELPTGSHAADVGRSAQQTANYRSLYNRVNLDNWKVRSGQWEANDWRLMSGAGAGEIEVPLDDNLEHMFFDFKRSGEAAGDKLPFRIGEVRFSAAGEETDEWQRVHIDLTDDEIKVTFGETRQVAPRTDDTPLRLVLVNDGTPIEFCNIYMRTK